MVPFLRRGEIEEEETMKKKTSHRTRESHFELHRQTLRVLVPADLPHVRGGELENGGTSLGCGGSFTGV